MTLDPKSSASTSSATPQNDEISVNKENPNKCNKVITFKISDMLDDKTERQLHLKKKIGLRYNQYALERDLIINKDHVHEVVAVTLITFIQEMWEFPIRIRVPGIT